MAARVSQLPVEVLYDTSPDALVSQQAVEALYDTSPDALVSQQAVEVLVSNAVSAKPVPPVLYGPPVLGGPWTQFRRPEMRRAIPSPTELLPDVVNPPQNYPQPVRVGPPVPGAPWTQFFRIAFPFPVADNTPPEPEVPTGPGRGKSRPYIARIPKKAGRINERRQARTSEQIHYILNALITRGELRQFGPSSWQLVSGGHTAEADPTANDDIANGFVVGSTWVNTLSGQAFVCVSNARTNAVWKQVTV